MLFKVGDKVKCIDISGPGCGALVLGQIYTVAKLDRSGMILIKTQSSKKEMLAFYKPYRFVLYEEEKSSSSNTTIDYSNIKDFGIF